MNQSIYLYLVNGERTGEGFWKIGATKNVDPLKSDKNFLECYRKELIGEDAAKEILMAIQLNIDTLINSCLNDGYEIPIPSEGISYDLPLSVIEEIFEFWLNLYKDPILFKKVVKLLKLKKNIDFTNPTIVKGIKGITAEWIKKLELLNKYRPPSATKSSSKDPMWVENQE
ncbi:josephin [Prochlorococcus marinus]|uniref:josephin n=1 Tax=Prochlorococcus marinus TaxID=1219 RepID=UPI0022B49617|nr:josephin [Prochlorococcus marinus]